MRLGIASVVFIAAILVLARVFLRQQRGVVAKEITQVAISDDVSDDVFMQKMKQRMTSRKEHVEKMCSKLGLNDSVRSVRDFVFYIKKYNTMYCQIQKTGNTNWKKLFAKLVNIDMRRVQKVGFEVAFRNLLAISGPTLRRKLRNDDVIKLIVVREPFERILSAFRDKLDAKPEASFRGLSRRLNEKFGKKPGKSYVDFNGFVSYLVNSNFPLNYGDKHWKMYHQLCQPCAIDYDVIVHQETVDEDSRYFLKLIGAPNRFRLADAYKRPTDDVTVTKYYETIEPRDNLGKLYELLRDDYLLFNYSRPAVLP